MNIIAADIGGTNCRLAHLELYDGQVFRRSKSCYQNNRFDDFEAVLHKFLQPLKDAPVDTLVLAVPAPVQEGDIHLTNLDWTIRREQIARDFDIREIHIINDLQAAVLGTLSLTPEKLVAINDRPANPDGKRIAIGAGTGLGVACLHLENHQSHSYATEAGHSDFAPAGERQEALYHFLQQKYGHVSWERVISGPGIVDCYRFCSGNPEQEVSAEWVNAQATEGNDPAAVESMHLFARVYGAFAGNMALTHRPDGGIWLVGGVSIKTRKWLQSDDFLTACTSKGRMRHLAEQTPIWLVLDADNGLNGAIEYALSQAGAEQQSLTAVADGTRGGR